MKIKKRTLSNIKQQLLSAANVKNTAFAKLLGKNVDIVDKHIKELTDAVSVTGIDESHKDYQEIAEFETCMRDTYPKFCRQSGGGGMQLADGKGWSEELEKLKLKYPAGAKYFDENEVRIKAILEETIDVDFMTVKSNDLPTDLSYNDLLSLDFMIEKQKEVIVK
jgi:hypothetical protein